MRKCQFEIGDLIGRDLLVTASYGWSKSTDSRLLGETNLLDPQIYRISQRKIFTASDLELYNELDCFSFRDKADLSASAKIQYHSVHPKQVYLVAARGDFNTQLYEEHMLIKQAYASNLKELYDI